MADLTAYAEVSLSATGHGDVKIDGQSIGEHVRRLLLTAQAGEPPRLVLELGPRAFEVDADGTQVGVSPVGQLLLHQFGWLSPAEAQELTAARDAAREERDSEIASCQRVTDELMAVADARDGLAELVAEILREFTLHGHPGEPSTSSGWLPDSKVNGWRERLAMLTEASAPAEPEEVQNLLDDATRAFADSDSSSERVEVIRDLLAGWYALWPPGAVTDPHEPIAWQLASLISAAEARASQPAQADPAAPPPGWAYVGAVWQLQQRIRDLMASDIEDPQGLIAAVCAASGRVEAELAKLTPAGIAPVGRCGHQAPALVGDQPRLHCALPHGHPGWHRSDTGTEWTPRTDAPPDPPAA